MRISCYVSSPLVRIGGEDQSDLTSAIVAKVQAQRAHWEAWMGFDTNEIELWHVQMPGGAVRTMSLDDLDTAFNDDVINEHTMVVKAGDQTWQTLGDLLGLNAPPPSYVVTPAASVGPPSGYAYASTPSYPPPSYAPAGAYASTPSYIPSAPSYAASTPSYAPSAPSYAPHNSYAPNSYDSLGQIQSQPNSIAPFATDIAASNISIPRLSDPPSFDMSPGTDELEAFRPKRRYGRAFAAVATVAVMGFALFSLKTYGVAGVKAKLASAASFVKTHSGESARASAGAPPAVIALPPPVNAPPMANAPPAPIDPSPITPSSPSSSSDKNAKNGKKTTDKKAAGKAAPAGGGKKAPKTSSDPTQRGSGQFDPLNGNI